MLLPSIGAALEAAFMSKIACPCIYVECLDVLVQIPEHSDRWITDIGFFPINYNSNLVLIYIGPVVGMRSIGWALPARTLFTLSMTYRRADWFGRQR